LEKFIFGTPFSFNDVAHSTIFNLVFNLVQFVLGIQFKLEINLLINGRRVTELKAVVEVVLVVRRQPMRCAAALSPLSLRSWVKETQHREQFVD